MNVNSRFTAADPAWTEGDERLFLDMESEAARDPAVHAVRDAPSRWMGVSPLARHLFHVLCCFTASRDRPASGAMPEVRAWTCFPGLERLALAMGVTENTVRKAREQLREARLLAWNPFGFRGCSTLYAINRELALEMAVVGKAEQDAALAVRARAKAAGRRVADAPPRDTGAGSATAAPPPPAMPTAPPPATVTTPPGAGGGARFAPLGVHGLHPNHQEEPPRMKKHSPRYEEGSHAQAHAREGTADAGARTHGARTAPPGFSLFADPPADDPDAAIPYRLRPGTAASEWGAVDAWMGGVRPPDADHGRLPT